MKRIATALTVYSTVFLLGCSSGERLQNDVARVQIGASKASAMATLGPPIATNIINILWVEKQTLLYRNGATICSLEIVFDRVVARGCQALPI